jgi:hypothetical protein
MSLRALLRSTAIPDEVKFAFRQAYIEASPEVELWRAVVERVVLDVFGDVGVEDIDAVQEARDWFSDEPEQVRLVFENACLDHALVLTALKRVKVL